jgi:hypothetical protein
MPSAGAKDAVERLTGLQIERLFVHAIFVALKACHALFPHLFGSWGWMDGVMLTGRNRD